MLSSVESLRRGLEHHRAGRLAQAEAAYRQALARDRQNPDALHLLGLIDQHRGRNAQAEQQFRRAIRIRPNIAAFHASLAGLLQNTGRLEEAVTHYRQALEQQPSSPELYNNLGNTLIRLKRFAEAASAFERALTLQPDLVLARCNLGGVLVELGRLEEAEFCFRRALDCDPRSAEAWNNLGVALERQGRHPDAVAAYREALGLKPEYADALNNVANFLFEEGRLEEAAAHYRHVLRIEPAHADALSNLGNALYQQGSLEPALDCYRRALAAQPRHHLAHSNLLLCLHYDSELGPEALSAEHRRWACQHARPLASAWRPHPNSRTPDRRLRVGYVSPDFRRHSVAFFIEPVLRAHDASQMEVSCYADVPRPDRITERLRALAHNWRDIRGWADEQVAEQVRRDEIDILVDLAGHTSRNRLLVFARKPAPIQVTWLGYPNTTGLDTVDYRITDCSTDPEGETDSLHSETLLRLPHGFLCYRPPEGAPEVSPLPARSAGAITFGSFNHLPKITSRVVTLWASILAELPGSKLVLKSNCLGYAEPRHRIEELFRNEGIAPGRLRLLDTAPSLQEHLGLYGEIDIALDPFPYSGTTTTCEALWMGVPVIALAGRSHVSRVAAGLLSGIGRPEWIAHSPEEYRSLALRLAADWDRLEREREGLRDCLRHAPLTDAALFTRSVEQAYRAMWRRWCGAVAP